MQHDTAVYSIPSTTTNHGISHHCFYLFLSPHHWKPVSVYHLITSSSSSCSNSRSTVLCQPASQSSVSKSVTMSLSLFLCRRPVALYSPMSVISRGISSNRKKRHQANMEKYSSKTKRNKGEELPFFQSLMRKLYLRCKQFCSVFLYIYVSYIVLDSLRQCLEWLILISWQESSSQPVFVAFTS